jgi:type III secretion protein S
MNSAALIEASYRALMLVFLLSLPAVLTAALVGLATSIVQAVTQIQDQGMGLALKLLAVLGVLALSSKWIATQMYHNADLLFTSVGMVGADVH